ncbi:Integrase catalytic core protein [Phytophthora palmivora]|uniref:Integrase catalytic core protein n=1 Tax=Phytophthora palmivora TaxID=4796 RepID=A0A2P4X1D7_9STRA|nr:Integrase catalytic core protein [Phytophthora palmivora]
MSKYTPDLVRELILTAEVRNKDWEKNAFGSNQGKKKQGNALSGPKGKASGDGFKKKASGDGSKKKSKGDITCFNCGAKGHYKSDCPDLEEKPSAEKKASAKMARSGEKPVKKTPSEQTDDDDSCVHKRDVVVGEVVKRVAKDYDASRWYFDSGTNAHIVTAKEYFTVLNSIEDSDWNPNISGFADGVDAKAEGFGTILLATMIDEEMVFVFLEDVLYVPKAGCNLFSPGQALEQGFKMSWEQETMMFGMTKDGTEVLRAGHNHRLWTFNVHNIGGVKVDEKSTAVKKQVVANFAVTDGVEDIDTFDEFIRDGDLDDDGSDSEASQRAECDADSVRDDSNVEMQSVAASADDLDEAEQVLWNNMVRNSVLPNVDGSNQNSDLAEKDQQLWEDILRNSSLPDYDNACETQESGIAEAYEAQEGEDVGSAADDAASIDAQAESEVSDDIESDIDDIDEHEDETSDLQYEPAGTSSHVSDLAPVPEEETESDLEDDNEYDYLFDPSDVREAGSSSGASGDGSEPPAHAENGVLAIPSEMLLIGKVHPRDEEVRRTRDKKRTKVGAKLAAAARRPGLREVPKNYKSERFEDYDVYSAFKALHADRRGNGGLRASDIKIPKNYRQAMRSKQAKFWREAMDAEMAALKDKGVLRQIPRSELPSGQQTIKTMWVFDVKTDHLGYIVRYRPRVVARGDKQRFGIDFMETFSPVARMATFRTFVAVCIILNLMIYQGDINTAYLNAALGIKQYLEEVEGYPCDDNGMIYIIEKALYGLRQSGREWHSEVNRWFVEYGFKQCETEPCLYFYDRDGEFAIVLLYVDDILCATNNVEFKERMFEQLDKDYGLKDQGLLNTYLGVQVEQNLDSIKIHQTKYCEEILERFSFQDAHPSRIPMETNMRLTVKDTDVGGRKEEPANGKKFPYRELVGSLMYLTTCTRPDLSFSVGQLSRYVQNPTQQHIGAAKRVLRYLVGTKTQGIVYTRNTPTEQKPELIIDGYCDSDWGNDPDTRKSITGFVHCMAGGAVSWASRRQTIVAQSTAEAEYVAVCEACMEGQGLRNMLIQVFSRLED